MEETPSIDVRPTQSGVLVQWKSVLTVAGIMLAIGGSWASNKASVDWTRAALEKDEAVLQDQVRNGHPDHERRIAALEAQKSDRLAVVVEQQSKQIDAIANALTKQADAQKSDHDLIVRLAAVMEAQARGRKEDAQ
jgi:hypothetical protein